MKEIWITSYKKTRLKIELIILFVLIGYFIILNSHLIFIFWLPLLIMLIAGLYRQCFWVADRELCRFTGTSYVKSYLSYWIKRTTRLNHFIMKYLWVFKFKPYPECRLISIKRYEQARQDKKVSGNYVLFEVVL